MLSRIVSNIRLWWTLRRLDTNTILADESCQELRLFMFVRNESLRLPFFIQYYRSLGVSRFFIVDNGSTDSTVELLLQEADVHVWSTEQPYSRAGFGMDWLNVLLQHYGLGRWCVVVDADEFFVLPWKQYQNLPSICKALQAQGVTGMRCLLLDVFLNKQLADIQYKPGDNLMELEWYYDADWSLYTYGAQGNLSGGMRQRVFGVSACLIKNPLFFAANTTQLQPGMHVPSADIIVSNESGVLLHGKYLQDFASRVTEESRREEHWNEAIEYKAYANVVRGYDTNLWHEDAVLFEGCQQLADQSFIILHP